MVNKMIIKLHHTFILHHQQVIDVTLKTYVKEMPIKQAKG
jgi:hypothetical protein